MIPTLQDLLDYLGIDYADDVVKANANRSLATAIGRLHGAVGANVEQYLPDDARIAELVLIYARESYDADNLSEKARAALKHLRDDLEPQLRLELRAAKETAGVI